MNVHSICLNCVIFYGILSNTRYDLTNEIRKYQQELNEKISTYNKYMRARDVLTSESDVIGSLLDMRITDSYNIDTNPESIINSLTEIRELNRVFLVSLSNIQENERILESLQREIVYLQDRLNNMNSIHNL